MRFIGNILTDSPFDDLGVYNVVAERASLIPDIPTLIIGWERTKSEYPDASIIEWKVADGVYWTYEKYERRDKYEENLKKFYDLAIKHLLESVKYTFFDILLNNYTRFNDFIASIKDKTTNKNVYIVNDMLYVYYFGSDKIIGISIRDCQYMSEDYKKEIFSAIYNNESVTVIKSKEDISKALKYKIKDREYIIPYLFS